VDREIEEFYDHLLAILRRPVVKSGNGSRLPVSRLGTGTNPGIPSCPFLARIRWRTDADHRELRAPSQPVLSQPAFPEIQDRSVRLKDLLSSACYIREGNELLGADSILIWSPGPIMFLTWRLHREGDNRGA